MIEMNFQPPDNPEMTPDDLQAEIDRLNKWADEFSNAQIKERQTGEMYQRELQATIDQQAAKIAKLEERIRVADAEEPVAYFYSCPSANRNCLLDTKQDWADSGTGLWIEQPLYLHAQIPAEVELKAKIAAMQLEIDRMTSNQCSGHFRIGCNYMSGCNTICNKCGHVHNADTGLAYIQQLNAANQRIAELEQRIKDSQEQEPYAWECTAYGQVTRLTKNSEIAALYTPCKKLYAKPVIKEQP